jgi:hypothetical protein
MKLFHFKYPVFSYNFLFFLFFEVQIKGKKLLITSSSLIPQLHRIFYLTINCWKLSHIYYCTIKPVYNKPLYNKQHNYMS